MSIQWSGLGPELLLRLDARALEPLVSQLQRELRTAIRSNRLAAGERLPSLPRELARELGVSRGLVQEATPSCWPKEYVDARAGSGTRVAAGAAREPTTGVAPAARASRLTVDFRLGVPEHRSFPTDRLECGDA